MGERELLTRAPRRRTMVTVGVAVAALAAAAAIGIALAGDPEERIVPTSAAAIGIADVHGIGVDPADGALYIATHTGLFRTTGDPPTARRVNAPEQDLMGFTPAGPGRFLASGHPGADQNLPPRLGLIESVDGGRTWRSLSLQGDADFHVLRVGGGAIYGYDGRLLVSVDGRRWQLRNHPGDLVDLSVDPSDGSRLLAMTSDGLRRSPDGGRTWRRGSLDRPALLARVSSKKVFAVDGGGAVLSSPDRGTTWKRVGVVEGPPHAFTADRRGALYVARGDGAVDVSRDGGRTWSSFSSN